VNFDKADKIVDEQVKKMVFARLEKYGNDPKKAFKNLENEPVWWNEAQGIKIVKVKCWANLKNAETLRTNQENEGIAFVKSGNNHHVAIYENTKGKKFEKVVSLWEAVERKKQGLPVVDRTPSDGSKLIVSMQINESFVFGMGLDELKKAIIDHDYKLISKNLYRVQKLTSSDYWFRLHSEANIDDSKVAKDILKFISIRSPSNLDSIKVKINHLGRIEIVNE
jgi:CRISPR-associated endonuclease Csn1